MAFLRFYAILLGFPLSIFYQFSSPSVPTAGVVIDIIHNSSTKLINVLTFGPGGAILQSRGAHESFSTPFDEKSIHGAKRQTRLYSESAFSALTGFFNKKKPIQTIVSIPAFGCLLWLPYSVCGFCSFDCAVIASFLVKCVNIMPQI